MPSEEISVIFSYEKCADRAYPVVCLKLYKRIPELMAKVLEDAGFFVDVNEVEPSLRVTAWQRTDQPAMVQRIILALAAWNAQYCGSLSVTARFRSTATLTGLVIRHLARHRLVRRCGVLVS